MPAVSDAFQAAVWRHQAGDSRGAADVYRQILRKCPDHPGAWHLLGVACQQAGQPERAVEYIRRAITLDGGKVIYHNNLGVALRALGRREEACSAYRQALVLKPDYPDALSNLAVALHELGHYEEARPLFERALRIQPRHPDALYNLANLCQDTGRTAEAVRLYREAINVQPNRASAYNNLGNALLAERRPAEAVAAYKEAIALEPRFAEAHLNLGMAFAEQDDVAQAAQCYETASGLRPDKPLWGMRSLGLCPTVFQTVEELDQYRRWLEERLDVGLAVPLPVAWEDVVTDGFIPSFHLSHHGRDNRRLKEKFAGIFSPYFPQRRPSLGRGKPRIGFLVTRHHEGGFLRSTAGIIERLDLRRFEVVVLCSQGVLDRCRQEVHRSDVEWVGLPNHFSVVVERVAAARCDVLYHWQVGTDPLNYFLPFTRPAPVQCVGWGMHGTTGVAAVDYALSSRLFEPEGAQEHYTERLYQFRTLTSYQRRVSLPPKTLRRDFCLPERGSLYLCPQRMSKLHPDFDPLLRGILEANPEGHVVLLEGRHPHVAAQLRRRFEKTLAGAAKRVLFVPSQEPAGYYRLLSLADVVLDVPQYSSALTGYDAFALGVPVVTLPGSLMVQRYALGLYRKMGIDSLVVGSADEYVALAMRLGKDPDYRESMRSLIAGRSDALFEDTEVIREYEDFFEHALERAREEGL